MADRTFLLKIIGDVTGAKKALGEVETAAEKTSDRTRSAFGTIAGVIGTAAVIQFGKSVVSAASDQEQAVGAVNSVFKEYAGTINSFGDQTASSLGISKAEFSQLAAQLGALQKNAGVPLSEVAGNTKTLTERAADLAAMYGGTVPDAVAAMSSAFKGEFDPLEKYGVSLKASAVEAKAVAMGLVDAEGKATDYGKTMAAQALIMEQSADAQGTFAKESETVAGQTAIMKAQFADLQAEIGTKLLPVLVEAGKILRGLLTFVANNTSWLVPLAAAILGIVVAVKAWQFAQVAWTAATQIATAAQWLWNAAMMANPIGLIIIAIAAVIAIVVLLYTKVDWFRAAVDAAIDGVVAAFKWLWEMIQKVFNWVKDNWPLLLGIITGPFGLAVAMIIRHWDSIKAGIGAALDWIKNIVSQAAEWLSLPFRRAWDLIKTAWNNASAYFSSIVQGIKNVVSAVAEAIAAPFRRAWEMAKGAWQGASNWFRSVVNGITNVFSGIANSIVAPFRNAFNGIKNLWNSTVGRLSFTVPSWVPGIGGKGWSAPKLAKGGIVTRPTIALIGEAGPEAVVPLSGRNAPAMGSVVINVYALTASAEVGRKVYEALREYDRISGKAM